MLFARGVNRTAEKRREWSERSFEALAERYLDHINSKNRSADEDERKLKAYVLPLWRHRRYDQVTRWDVIDLVDRIVTRGAPVMAHRVQSMVSSIFLFALDEDLIAAHPSAGLGKRGGQERARPADEIPVFWRGIVQPPVTRAIGLALRLLLLIGCRSAEVARLHRSEVVRVDDDDAAHILLPESRTKTGKEHLVPLVGLGLATTREARRLSQSDRVFPSRSFDGSAIGSPAFSVERRDAISRAANRVMA